MANTSDLYPNQVDQPTQIVTVQPDEFVVAGARRDYWIQAQDKEVHFDTEMLFGSRASLASLASVAEGVSRAGREGYESRGSGASAGSTASIPSLASTASQAGNVSYPPIASSGSVASIASQASVASVGTTASAASAGSVAGVSSTIDNGYIVANLRLKQQPVKIKVEGDLANFVSVYNDNIAVSIDRNTSDSIPAWASRTYTAKKTSAGVPDVDFPKFLIT